jgi:hypothetical protein
VLMTDVCKLPRGLCKFWLAHGFVNFVSLVKQLYTVICWLHLIVFS